MVWCGKRKVSGRRTGEDEETQATGILQGAKFYSAKFYSAKFSHSVKFELLQLQHLQNRKPKIMSIGIRK